MTALPLFDSVYVVAIANDDPAARASRARLGPLAEELARGALNDIAEIDALDVCTAAPDADSFDPRTAALIRGMYERWVSDAGAVLERVAKVRTVGATVANAEALAEARGRVTAMLQLTPERAEIARQQFRDGRAYTREQLRAELGLRVQ